MPEVAARRIVAIHGAWQGGWVFDALRPAIGRLGWKLDAVDLPGNGAGPAADAPADLDHYAAHVSATIDAIGEPVVLLGHSGGAVTASQAAELRADRVKAIVYVAGIVLPSGVDFAALRQRHADPSLPGEFDGIVPYLDWNADHSASRVRPEGAQQVFLHDCEPAQAEAAAARLVWQPERGRAMRPRLTAERWGRLPKLYVECLRDRSIPLRLQQAMHRECHGCEVVSLDSGHVPQLARPEELAAKIAHWLYRTAAA